MAEAELPPELQVFLEAHPDWQHIVFLRRNILLQLIKPVIVEVDEPRPPAGGF